MLHSGWCCSLSSDNSKEHSPCCHIILPLMPPDLPVLLLGVYVRYIRRCTVQSRSALLDSYHLSMFWSYIRTFIGCRESEKSREVTEASTPRKDYKGNPNHLLPCTSMTWPRLPLLAAPSAGTAPVAPAVLKRRKLSQFVFKTSKRRETKYQRKALKMFEWPSLILLSRRTSCKGETETAEKKGVFSASAIAALSEISANNRHQGLIKDNGLANSGNDRISIGP